MSREVMVFRSSVNKEVEPYPFVLEFEDVNTGKVDRHEFLAQGNPGIGADFAVTSIIQIIDGKQVTDLNGMRRFYKRILLGDGFERLDALLEDQDVVIDREILGEVMNRLIGIYTGRPTQPPSGS